MHVYRIADARFGPQGGEGAQLYGGRWNSPGRAVIYACTSYAGAMLEKLVHMNGRMSKHQVCVVFSVPEDLEHRSIEAQDHPGWDADDYIVSRRVGDAWLASNASTVLLVPSVVFNVDRNVLINPSHRDFRRVDVVSTEPVRWDTRLFHRRDAIDGER